MGNFNLGQSNSYASGLEAKIGANSAVIDEGEAVIISSGFIAKASAGNTIEGVSAAIITLASDNQTVAQKKVLYRPVREGDHYLMRTIGTALTFDGDLVTSNTINLKVNGTAMTQVTFATSNAVTLAAIATQLETQFPTLIASADAVDGSDLVKITVVPGETVTLTDIVVAAGAGQAAGAQVNYFDADDVGKFFDIVATSQYVDGPTTHASSGQLRLEEARSQSYAVFSIANT